MNVSSRKHTVDSHNEKSIVVALLGGRQHYAVPRAFHTRGVLEGFVTDYWVSAQASAWLRQMPWKWAARLAGRSHPDLPSELVRTLPRMAKLHALRRMGLNQDSLYDFYCREGHLFAEGVNVVCRRHYEDLNDLVYFGFTSTSLETLQLFGKAGGITILDQIDPLCTEHEIIRRERARWPGWESGKERPNQAYIQRVKAEWHSATHVLVNSSWTAEALVEQGVPRDKLMVVPQAYEGAIKKPTGEDQYDGHRPLRVLWLGSVILRKGIPYLFEAARVLESEIEVRVVGPIGIAREKVAAAPENLSFLGQVPHVKCEAHWRWADLFVLPTLSDGFAITQLEAMARGLPVLATPNCGEVVEHGRNGLLVEPGSAEALTEAIANLCDAPDTLRRMSRNAVERVKEFTLDRYAERVFAGLGWSRNEKEEPTA